MKNLNLTLVKEMIEAIECKIDGLDSDEIRRVLCNGPSLSTILAGFDGECDEAIYAVETVYSRYEE